jgi:multiple sugar transport system permease protein
MNQAFDSAVAEREAQGPLERLQGLRRQLMAWWKPSMREAATAYICLSPWLVNFFILVAGAMIFSFYLSFTKSDLLTGSDWVGLANYDRLFTGDKLIPQAFKVTAIYAFGAVPLNTALALCIALLLNQDIKAQGVWRMLYYMPSIVSGVAISLLWAWMFNPHFGLINAALIGLGVKEPPGWIYSQQWAMPAFIIMSLWGAGGNMLLYLAGLQGIPTPLYDAAKVDGANVLRRFIHVTLPMLSPTIFFNLVMNVIGSWQVFTQSFIMTQGGPNNATLTVVLLIYRKAFTQFRHGYGSAIAWALFVVIMALTALVLRSSRIWVYYEGELRK